MFLKLDKPRVFNSLFALCFMFYFNCASSHPDASATDFCPNGQIINSSQHSIDGDFLAKFLKNQKVECPVGIRESSNPELDNHVGRTIVYNNHTSQNTRTKTHDVFDGPAKLAFSYASCVCSSLVNQRIDLDKRRPLLTGPESIISDTHHNNYRLIEGLKFMCNVCVSPNEQFSEESSEK